MQIALSVTAAPVVSISSSGVDLLAVGELDIQVLPNPDTPINALSFSIKTENIIKVSHMDEEKKFRCKCYGSVKLLNI